MQKGTLLVITGCMFSGKTTKLITLAQTALEEKKNIAIYYPEIDTRYAKNYITSHDAVQIPSAPLPIETNIIDGKDADIIFLDEIHFFNPSIINAIKKLLDEGKMVIVSGLDTNFRGDSFAITKELMSFADEVFVLKAKCTVCGNPAMWTYRVAAKKDDETIVVGGIDLYEARCEEHFIRPQ